MKIIKDIGNGIILTSNLELTGVDIVSQKEWEERKKKSLGHSCRLVQQLRRSWSCWFLPIFLVLTFKWFSKKSINQPINHQQQQSDRCTWIFRGILNSPDPLARNKLDSKSKFSSGVIWTGRRYINWPLDVGLLLCMCTSVAVTVMSPLILSMAESGFSPPHPPKI